jgi:hypothetical protein
MERVGMPVSDAIASALSAEQGDYPVNLGL